MIVPTMRADEVRREMLRDYYSVNRRATVFADLLRKEMQRKRRRRHTRVMTNQSARHNVWTILLWAMPGGIRRLSYVVTSDEYGLVAYLVFFDPLIRDYWMIKFTSHFLKRYRERAHPEMIDNAPLLRRLFKVAPEDFNGQSSRLEDGTRLIHLLTEEGMYIGWKDEERKIISYKTFLSHSMLSKNQKDLVTFIRNHNEDERQQVIIQARHERRKF